VDSGQAQICTAFFTKHRVSSPGEYLEIVADNLSKAGWTWGCVSAIDSNGQTIWIVDPHRDNGKRSVVCANERLTAFVEVAGNYNFA
jgi:hypothetical protein